MPIVGSTAYSNARAITALVRALLNDGSNLLSVPVNITSISRNNASGTVTVVTQLPHNMVAGDNTLVSGVTVGANSFNGTFPVQAVQNPQQFTYAQAGATETQANGQVQGYGIGAKFPDSALMPIVNANYQMLGRELENIASGTFIKDNVLLVVPAVATADPGTQVVINDATAAPNQLPPDLLMPLKIWERPNGSTDDFFEMVNLTDGGGLPSQPQGQTLEVWEWRTDGLALVGATQDTQIRLRYLAGFADLVDGTSSTLLRSMREAIAYPTAIIAGASKGAPVPDVYKDMGERALEQVLNAASRGIQHRNFRPKAFSRRKGTTPF